jgi:hypothetical protein
VIPGPSGFGVAWDPQWVDSGTLRIRGYRVVNAYPLIARWDVESLIATVDDALERTGWSERDRQAARDAIHELYRSDLQYLKTPRARRSGTMENLKKMPARRNR